MKNIILFLGLTAIAPSIAVAGFNGVTCGAYLGSTNGITQLASILINDLSGNISYSGINAKLQCKTNDPDDNLQNISCVGINTDHVIKLDVFSVDGVLNRGILTIDGVKIGSQSQDPQDRYLYCGRST